jgi:hypothetical protein
MQSQEDGVSQIINKTIRQLMILTFTTVKSNNMFVHHALLVNLLRTQLPVFLDDVDLFLCVLDIPTRV